MDVRDFDRRILSMKDRLYRLARGMLTDSAEADDAVQDVLERMWRRRDELEGNVEAFAYTSVRNLCIDRLRRRRLLRGANVEPEHEISHGIEVRDMHAAVRRVIAMLPEKQQLVIQLRDVEGCEFEEIASVVGMDESGVRSTLSRARKTVRERMLKIMNHGL